MKDTIFYNKESSSYSSKRYPVVASSYTQFFFLRRLMLTKKIIKKALQTLSRPVLLEVGCADGVVLRALEKVFPGRFAALYGIDIAEGMIAEAARQNSSPVTRFMLREVYQQNSPVDIILEIGVANYAGVDADVAFAADRLSPSGYYILSLAGTNSLHNRLKHESGFADFRSYAQYEALIRQHFTIIKVYGCGFFVPYLWRVPTVARVMQPVVEVCVGKFFPNLCHEKIYVLTGRKG